MKLLIFIILSLYASVSLGATCATTSRSNYSSFQVLGANALNNDFNQLVTKVNAFDGGCVTDGSLKFAALNVTDFAPIINGVAQGCPMIFVDANTLAIDKCMLTVNGKSIKTTTTNNVTWGCSGCSTESASTLFYIYAKNGSSGTTLNLLISNTAPNADGYDISSNKVIGSFYNNTASNIDQNSLSNWILNKFISSKGFSFTVSWGGTTGFNKCTGTTVPCFISNAGPSVASIARALTPGVYDMTVTKSFNSMSCSGNAQVDGSTPAFVFSGPVIGPTTVYEFATASTVTPFSLVDTFGTITCTGY